MASTRDGSPRKVTLFCPFGGGGGSGLGGQQAQAGLFERRAVVELLGGIDNVEGRCEDFEYLTGVPQLCADVSTMTTADLLREVGPRAPDIVFTSAPCKPASGLLPQKRSEEPQYVEMMNLALVMVRLLLETWETPPPILVFENVPRITSRGAPMLAEIRRLLRAKGYSIQDGYHDCGEIGELGQRRRRWFFVARHQPQVPFFLYKPPRKRVKACGEVLRQLPMPGDPAGGPMHRLPAQSAKNDARLTAIPPGGDWRDLIKDGTPRRSRFRRAHVERWTDPSITVSGPGANGPCGVADPRTPPPPVEAFGYIVPLTADQVGKPLDLAPARDWFRDAYGVLDPEGPASTVIGNARPPNGFFSVADSFSVEAFKGAWGVLDPERPSGAVTGESYVSNGSFAIADDWAFAHVHRVTPWTEPVGCITRSPAPSSGAGAVADPRIAQGLGGISRAYDHVLRVTAWCTPTGAITGAHSVSSGAAAVADPRLGEPGGVWLRPAASAEDLRAWEQEGRKAPGGIHWFKGKFSVGPWDAPARTIIGGPGNGGSYVADPRLRPQAGNDSMHWGKYVVLDPAQPARVVTGATRVGSGAQSIADYSLILPKKPAYDHAYGVLHPTMPSWTIAGTSAVGCGAYAIADVLKLTCEPRSGAYGVLDAEKPARTVVGAMKVDNSPAALAAPLPANLTGYGILPWPEARKIISGEVRAPFAVFDSRYPGGPPAAIVEDFDKPAFVWVETPPKTKRGKPKRKKVSVPLVMVAEDGTWHRPLTTLELASLQGLDWMHKGKPLCFRGGSTEQRETIGNMVPPPAARAIVEQMLLALLAADAGCFYLDSGGEGVWCRPETRRQLEREGIRIVHGKRPWNIGGAKVLDDGAVVKAKSRARRAPVLAKKTVRPRPLRLEALM